MVAVVKGSLEFLEVKIQGFSDCLEHTITSEFHDLEEQTRAY